MSTKSIRVACAVIEYDGKVLAAQRSSIMTMPLKWEFPGGKLHEGESPEKCLARELEEELCIRVRIKRALPRVYYSYDDFDIELIPFVCGLAGGRLMLREHSAIAWLSPHQLPELDWPGADIPVIASYLASIEGERAVRLDYPESHIRRNSVSS
ncbi:MAG: (deoxy)nucleoside triphosphate pyrophosphohydrolase [Geobacteraceae bacterium]|nr:(deoxy)nucleoside triphosphate pyrophosphohydrolase [Geobacteraceae bacterium]